MRQVCLIEDEYKISFRYMHTISTSDLLTASLETRYKMVIFQ